MKWPLFRCIFFPFVLLSLAANAQDQPAFQLAEPLENLTEPLSIEREIGGGPFVFSARLSLKRMERTAASVYIGERLNLGLDGREESFFVEGPAIGKVVMLTTNKGVIAAGKAFELRVTRDEADNLKATIISEGGETELHKMVLSGPIGKIRFRPHRGVINVLEATLEGDIGPPPPPAPLFELVPRNVPVRTDGSHVHVADLVFHPHHAGRLASVRVDAAGSPRVQAVALGLGPDTRLLATSGSDPAAAQFELVPSQTKLPAPMLPRRETRLPLFVQIAPGSNLDEPLQLEVTPTLVALKKRQTDTPDLNKITTQTQTLRLAASIHQRGQFDCHTFRIPGLARSTNGTLLAVYDMRYNSRRDLQGHMDIGLSRSTDGGITWAPPVPILDMGRYGDKAEDLNGVSDPNILVDEQTGEIFVAALWTHGKPGTHQWRGRGSEPGFEIGTTTQFMMTRSTDDGLTWSAPENWTRKLKKKEWWLFAPAPGNGITMRDGTLVMPTQGRDKNGLPFSNLMWSKDHGKTWSVSSHARDNTTECAIAECSDGALLLSMRDNRNRADKGPTNGRAMGLTRDLGASWSVHPADRGALPEPVCMASLIGHTLHDGRRLLLFSNPNDKQRRRNMCIQTSLDDGRTWRPGVHLDDFGGAYSNLVMVDDDTVGILYESSQADLLFQRVPLKTLLAGPE